MGRQTKGAEHEPRPWRREDAVGVVDDDAGIVPPQAEPLCRRGEAGIVRHHVRKGGRLGVGDDVHVQPLCPWQPATLEDVVGVARVRRHEPRSIEQGEALRSGHV
jgi:hypothetical protein